ncbi:MAG: glycosyltransferase family 4 protein [Kovacikia sp.]
MMLDPASNMSAASTFPILVVSRTFFPKEGGIEEYIYNRCLQDPEQVVVLSASLPGDQDFDQAQPFPVYRWPVPAFLQTGKLGSVLRQILYLFWSVVWAIRLYFRYRYHAIEWGHGYDFPSLLLLSYLLPCKCFLHLHGNDLLCPQRHPLLQAGFTWTLNRMQGVVCNSSFTQKHLLSHFDCQVPTYVINPTVRPSKFGEAANLQVAQCLGAEIRKQYGIHEKAIVILSVGRLVRRKGFDRVIENLPLLRSQGLEVHYLVCGRGALEAELKTLAEHLGVADQVHFAGFVPDEQLAGYYAACDFFSMLTFFSAEESSIEGFGIVYVEAAYFGKPVLASRIGGVVDAVHHEKNGILVDPDSPEAVSNALLRLCQDQELRKRMGIEGQRLSTQRVPYRSIYPTYSSLPNG